MLPNVAFPHSPMRESGLCRVEGTLSGGCRGVLKVVLRFLSARAYVLLQCRLKRARAIHTTRTCRRKDAPATAQAKRLDY